MSKLKSYMIVLLLFTFFVSVDCVFAKFTTGSLHYGVSVTPIGPGGGTATQICTFDPKDSRTMYVGGDCQGVMRTFDGGQTWDAPNKGLLNPEDPYYAAYYVLDIEVDPTNTNNVYAGTQYGLYKSTDKAENWTKLDLSSVLSGITLEEGSSQFPIGVIEVDPADSNIIYASFGDTYSHDLGKGLFIKSIDGGLTWQRLGQNVIASDAIIYGIALDPGTDASSRRIIITSDKGVYLSEDGGATITNFEVGLPHANARRIAVSRSSSGTTVFNMILKITGDSINTQGGIYKWTVGDSSWTDVTANLVKYQEGLMQYGWIEMHPTNPDIVYVTSAAEGEKEADVDDVYKTIDGGATWEGIVDSFSHGWLESYQMFDMFALAPSSPDTLLAGIIEMNLSQDGGINWTQIYTNIQEGSPRQYSTRGTEMMWSLSIAIDPRSESPDTLYAGYADSLLFKTDNLNSFRRLSAEPLADPVVDFGAGWGFDSDVCPQVTLDPSNPDIVYMSASFRLYKSTDKGETWTKISTWENPYSDRPGYEFNGEGLRDNACRFAIDPSSSTESRTIYATVYPKGLYKSTDGGTTWTSLSGKIGTDASKVSGVYLDPTNSQRIYLGTYSLHYYATSDTTTKYPVYFSEDGGETWVQGGSLPPVNKILIDPSNSTNVLAAAIDSNQEDNEGGVYLSSDGGRTWTRMLSQPSLVDMAIDPHYPGTIYSLSNASWENIPGQMAGVYKSSDSGVTWSRLDLGLNFYGLYPIVVHPTRKDELYIGTGGKGVLKVNLSSGNTSSLSATIEANKSNFILGDTIEVTVKTEGESNVDIYAAVKLPDGTIYCFTESGGLNAPNAITPLATNNAISGSTVRTVMTYSFNEPIPQGTYELLVVLVSPGLDPVNSGNWLTELNSYQFIFQ